MPKQSKKSTDDINFLFELDVLSRILEKKINEKFKAQKQGISYKKYMLLRLIKDGITMKELGKLTQHEKGNLSRDIAHLRLGGYIFKILKNDHKTHVLVLKEKGEKVIKSGDLLLKTYRKNELRFIKKIEAEKITTIYQNMQKSVSDLN